MRPLAAALFGAVATAATLAAAGAFAGGGPPPGDTYDPELRTVVTHGAARLKVVVPAHRSNKTIERAVRAARRAAYPKAVKSARREAGALATAAGLRLEGPLGAARDVSPYGYYDPDAGSFGPGRWCGRIVTSRLVTGSDGVRRRVRRSHQACPVPRDLVARITVTFAVR
jgi:hypothetical protein